MNPTIKQLSSRKSIRQFTGQSVSNEDLELIFKTANYLKTILEEDNIDREDNLNFRTPLDIEQLQLPVRAKNFLQSLKIFSW